MTKGKKKKNLKEKVLFLTGIKKSIIEPEFDSIMHNSKIDDIDNLTIEELRKTMLEYLEAFNKKFTELNKNE